MRPILLSERGSSFLPRTERGAPIRERSGAFRFGWPAVRNKTQQIGYCQTQLMIVLTIRYNLGEQPMTVLEHIKFSLQSAQGPRGSGVFH